MITCTKSDAMCNKDVWKNKSIGFRFEVSTNKIMFVFTIFFFLNILHIEHFQARGWPEKDLDQLFFLFNINYVNFGEKIISGPSFCWTTPLARKKFKPFYIMKKTAQLCFFFSKNKKNVVFAAVLVFWTPCFPFYNKNSLAGKGECICTLP
jgi:hypothetical protein